MSTKHTRKIFVLGALLFLMGTAFAQKGKKAKDPLDKKIYNNIIIEVKDGVNSKKSLPDEIEFKDGKLFSTFINEKFGFKWVKYKLVTDSTYIDETEVTINYYAVECSVTDDKDITMTLKCTIDNFDIDGEIKLTKGDKPKKAFVFNGKEKYVKPKKKDEKKEEKKEG
jgi:hypothetical protein